MSDSLVVDNIREGLPGISIAIGNHLAEACIVCLHRSSHNNGTEIIIEGIEKKTFKLLWGEIFNEQIDRSWKDQIVATEHGAACLAVLILLKLTNYTIIERSVRKTGFDYWLGSSNKDDILYQKKARLEVSGIFKGNTIDIKNRLKQKLTQTNQSDDSHLPAFISIVEFSMPYANFIKKNEYNGTT